MARKELKNIFLSASIPLKERHYKYYNTADIIAIRDSVIALASLVLPKYRLIWGGHPSITPIIYYVLEKYKIDIQSHVKLYQSEHFEKIFPIENKEFETVVITEDLGELKPSLRLMRERMLGENTFEAGVFIGGMDGIEDEYTLFRELNPRSIILPIASTGAASRIIFDSLLPDDEAKEERFLKDYGYMSLFQKYLMDRI